MEPSRSRRALSAGDEREQHAGPEHALAAGLGGLALAVARPRLAGGRGVPTAKALAHGTWTLPGMSHRSQGNNRTWPPAERRTTTPACRSPRARSASSDDPARLRGHGSHLRREQFDSSPLDGTVNGDTWLGIEGNGWSNPAGDRRRWRPMSRPAALGGQDDGARRRARLRGCRDHRAIDGDDVLGIFAANDATILAWGDHRRRARHRRAAAAGRPQDGDAGRRDAGTPRETPAESRFDPSRCARPSPRPGRGDDRAPVRRKPR